MALSTIILAAGLGTRMKSDTAKVLHRVSPAAAGDLRVVLSMTFNTERRISRFGEFMRRVKDTAFYGLRVLWD